MSIIQALLIGFVYYFTNSAWNASLALYTLYKPMLLGVIVGAILGDVQTGITVGLSIQLIFMGFLSTGGSMPSDPTLSGLLGTAMAIVLKPELGDAAMDAGLALSVAMGSLGTFAFIGRMTWNSTFVGPASKAAKEGDLKGLFMWNVAVPQIVLAVVTMVPVTLFCMALGNSAVVETLTKYIGMAIGPLSVIGSLLPTVGIAMTLMAIGKKHTLPFFIVGFMLSQYLGLDIISISIFGVIVAFLIYFAFDTKNTNTNNQEAESDF